MESGSRSWSRARLYVVAVTVMAAATSEAVAVPNPRCAGACEDGVTACGSAADCAGARCVFPDACLPGLARLVEAVLPEAPGGVDDPTTWSCGALSCHVEGDALAFASTFGIDATAVKDLVLERGRRYMVRAEMRADAGAWGWLEVTGESLHAVAPEVIGARDWAPTSVVFEVPPGSAPMSLQLRLHADGGELAIRRVVVYVLGDYGVWLRWSLVEPAVDATFHLGRVLRHVSTPPGATPVPCADGALAGCIDPRFATIGVAAGEPSPWVEFSAMLAGGERATLGWDLEVDGAPSDDSLVVRAEVAWRPEDDAVLWSGQIAPGAARVGLVLPEGLPSPDRIVSHVGWVRDLVAADRAAFIPASGRPERVTLGMMVNNLDLFDHWPSVAEDALALEADLGLNAASYMTAVPRAEDHARAASLGLDRRFVDAASLLPIDASYDLDLDRIADDVRARLDGEAWRELARAIDDPEDALALAGPVGRSFTGPAYRMAFHAWLADVATNDGLAPDDFGVARFEDVAPLEGPVGSRLPELRPTPIDPHAARRFVWAWRFWRIASARAWSAALGAWRDATGIDWRLLTELEESDDASVSQRASGGLAVAFGGGGETSDCRVGDLGFFADRAAGVVSPWRSGSYPLVGRLDAGRGDLGRAALELMARGFNAFDHARYGPYDLVYAGAGGGLGEGSRAWLERVARASELIARAEGPLAGARREVSPIVILGAESDPLWSDRPAGSVDELGWHMALSQAHLPVDVMPESEVAAGRLEGPDAPRRFLFVLRKHVSKDAFVAIRRWVEAGGTLVTGPDLATHDENGQLDIERATWLSIAPSDQQDGPGTVQWLTPDGVTTFSYAGPWLQILGVGATTIAVIDDDRPVVVRVPRGRGRIVAMGLPIGEAYRRPVEACDPRPGALPPAYPGGFSQSMRRAMTSLVAPLDAIRGVVGDDPRLAVHTLTTPAGPVVVAIAWTDAPSDFVLSAAAWRGCSVVHEHIDDYDLPVIFGSLLMRIDRAAIITWSPATCERPPVAEPVVEDAREEDVAPRPADDGGCAGAPWSDALALALLIVARRRGSVSLG